MKYLTRCNNPSSNVRMFAFVNLKHSPMSQLNGEHARRLLSKSWDPLESEEGCQFSWSSQGGEIDPSRQNPFF